MHIPILTAKDDISSKIGEVFIKNSVATTRVDWALLQAYDQLQRELGWGDQEMSDNFGADFLTTGTSQLTNDQKGTALAILIRLYLRDLARGGQNTMLDNQSVASEVPIDDSDFEEGA